MSDRSLKKSLAGKSNHQADENLDLFSVNRGTSLDVLLKPGIEQAKDAKPEADDKKKYNRNQKLYTIPEATFGALSRLVLEARNAPSKLQQPFSITKTSARSESDVPSLKPTRSGSTIRPSNIPTIRSSSVPKKTTTTSASASASVPSPKRIVSRSLTPVSRKTPSPSPSRISTTTTSTTPSFKKAGDAQRSRSLTPRSKPLISASSASPSNKTNARSTTPQTPPRVKEAVTLAFGRPVGTTTGNVNSLKRNTSPDVTRIRPKGHSTTFSSLIPTFSGTSHKTAAPKSVKPIAEPTKSGKKLSKASVQMAINHLDVSRNKKVGTQAFSSTMLYPHSIRSSSTGIRKAFGTSSEGSSSSNQDEEEGKSLTKEEGNNNTEMKNDSARYDTLLNVKDVKDTNWLLNIDDESHHSLIFDNAFDSPPDLFSPR